MNRIQRSKLIIHRLDETFPNPPIPLYHNNAFTLLVSVLLSAQSTDKKVNELTPELFKHGNSAKDLYKLGEKHIYSYIKQLGLANTKAKNIFKLSKIILNKYQNEVPKELSLLESLPGVGHKTASVVMAQAFGVPSFPVDTHIHRLAQRWGLTSGKNVRETEKDLKKIFPKEKWNKLHLQIIYYGRAYCSARGCDGTRCDICKELYPLRKKPFIHTKA
ncbi:MULTISPECIES: endonuclease III [unclassified Prochlorococcus]|uniref:endonuclease III n=1 Tax=unclassified Prochlorococcus TaxID=2627481 RepID=UPI000533A66E|nr:MULTISPECIES: endonuclease III [unclassified Prochlorococcus]KGG15197.1 Endonuclease III [Prochlorococcus sp. MIT 0602]KGG17471.1 Endonuclease III [Prochlorococcus sp. MIT 0603]